MAIFALIPGLVSFLVAAAILIGAFILFIAFVLKFGGILFKLVLPVAIVIFLLSLIF